MTDVGHKPGPWAIHDSWAGTLFIKAPDGEIIVLVSLTKDETEEHADGSRTIRTKQMPHARGDANLIVAAPEMYREIETAIQYLEAAGYDKEEFKDEPEYHMLRGFRAAINKAKGIVP